MFSDRESEPKELDLLSQRAYNEGEEADTQGNTLITASLDNIARTFSYPGNEYTGYVTRSSSVPIRWVSMDKKGERVAVCSEYVPLSFFSLCLSRNDKTNDSDLLVKVVYVGDTTRVSLLSDNTKSIRSATWDPTGKYLVGHPSPLFTILRK
jgi:chromosome transmission fidelity protein 4